MMTMLYDPYVNLSEDVQLFLRAKNIYFAFVKYYTLIFMTNSM